MANNIIGIVEDELPSKVTYTGGTTDTASVTIDNTNRIIYADFNSDVLDDLYTEIDKSDLDSYIKESTYTTSGSAITIEYTTYPGTKIDNTNIYFFLHNDKTLYFWGSGELKTNGITIKSSGIVNLSPWFDTSVKRVIIGKGITALDSYAFCGFTNLLEVTLPETLKTIERGAFNNCPALKYFVIPKSVTTIGSGGSKLIFDQDEALTSIKIEDGCTIDVPDNYWGATEATCTYISKYETLQSGIYAIGDVFLHNGFVCTVLLDFKYDSILDKYFLNDLTTVKASIVDLRNVDIKLDTKIDSTKTELNSTIDALATKEAQDVTDINSKITETNKSISDLATKEAADIKAVSDQETADVKTLQEADTAINGRVTTLENSIPSKLDTLEKKITNDLQPKINAVANQINNEVEPKLVNLDDKITALDKAKTAAMFYDEEGILDAAGEGNKYWYLMDSPSFDPTDIESLKEHALKDASGNLLAYSLGKGGGGGGGTDTNVVVNQVNWPTDIAAGGECKITVEWSSLKGETPTGVGTLQVYINGVMKTSRTGVKQGQVEFDISNYLAEGSNKVMVVAIDSYENSSRTVGYINQLNVSLTSNFDDNNILSGTVSYTYIPYGSVAKTVHFIVDGEDVAQSIVKTSGEQQTQVFTGWTHGHHTLKVYFTCVVSETEITSNSLYYDLIYDGGLDTPIIASTYTNTQEEQFNSFSIPYRVYTPGQNDSNVDLIINNEIISTLTVDQSTHYWSTSQDTIGNYTYQLKSGDVVRTFPIEIIENEIDVQPVADNKILEYLTAGRTNTESHPEVWTDTVNGLEASLTGFNFSTDGWIQKTEDGVLNTVLRVSGDARVEIPFEIFEKDFKTNGKTIEIEFATSDVLDYNTEILSCFSGERGIKITPQIALIKSQQSELETQYKEDDHVRVTFIVEKSVENRIVGMYINGVMCGAVQYPTTDNFRQLEPVNISIGSNDATIDIYCIRVYENDLNRKQVVNNWIADTQSGDLKRTRYLHNNNYNDSGEIVTSKLPTDVPYMIWNMDELPQYKGDKRPGDVEYVDQLDDTRNFTSTNAQYNVQGTSSAVYPVKNIRIKYKQNKDWPDKEFTWLDKEGNTIKKYKITTPDGIGDNYFTYKVDYASSEGANNVELTKYYNDVSKAVGIKTPPQVQDSRVRVGIDGYPIVAFQRDADDKVNFVSKANFNNDKANEDVYGFYSENEDDYSKPHDESWETTQNSAEEALFKKPVTQENLGNAFEIRYPDVDGYNDVTLIQPMTEWVYSTWTEKATNKRLPDTVTFTYTNVVRAEDGSYSTKTETKSFERDTAEYRLTKFKAELKDHFDVNSTLFYYLFTHVFLMVDSRAKNAFPTYFVSREAGDGGNRWYWLPYDMDTAIGINNEGKLVFDYNLEDTDKVDGANVFNGQDSVMWCNVRNAFDGELGQLYSNMRTNVDAPFSYDEIESRFEEHQAKWSEVIFNEDSYQKYIVPLSNNQNYLEMLQGSKAEQRKWWLYNRFKYFDSKYLAGDSKSDYMQFRAYVEAGVEKPSITVVPYADIYATVSYANGAASTVAKRATRGEEITLENPISKEASETDQETYIYSVSQLKSVGDLSVFKPDTVDISNATRLQELKVGDADESYENPHLTSLALGSNKLLKKLDVRHCTALAQAIDASKCTNLEEVYFDGSKISGLTLPSDGGILKKLHLPDTITNLTIRNQKSLEELVLAGTENVQTLWLENVPAEVIDAKSLITSIKTGSAVRLVGFKQTVSSVEDIDAIYDALDTMTGLNAQGQDIPKAYVDGVITIDNIPYSDWVRLSNRYPHVTIKSDHIMCTVTFYNDETVFKTQLVIMGNDAEDPGVPHKASTAAQYYTFNSWDKSFKDVQKDIDIHASFDGHTQVYTFKFDPQTTMVDPIPDETVEYNGLLAKPADPSIEGATFNGWFKEAETVNQFDFTVPVVGPFNPDENDKPLPITLYGKWTDQDSPSVSIEIADYNKFNFTITDNIAVNGYAITTEDVEPTEFISITPTTSYTNSYTVEAAGTYYVWGKDASSHLGKLSVKAFELNKDEAEGSTITLKYGDVVLTDFILQGREILIHADIDNHYENLVIYKNDTVISNDSSVLVDNDITIKTECSPKSYTVKFDIGEHGTPVADQIIVYGHKATKPQNQFDTGVITEGWYKEETLVNRWDFDVDTVSNDMTLYAKWVTYVAPTKITVSTENPITLNFNQTAANGVSVKWGDGAEEETSSSIGDVSLSHTYSGIDEAVIEITCNSGTHLLGRDINREAVMPAASVKTIEFAYNMPYTNSYAFKDCINLTDIKLTNYMTAVAIGTFEGCTSVTELVIPDNITRIEASAFQDCSGITGTITLPNTLVTVGDQAFSGCTSIEGFDIPDTLTTIGNSSFNGCSLLASIELTNITSIGSSAFAGCSSLETVELPECLETIGASALSACSNLSKVIINGKDTQFGSSVFNVCQKLKTAGPIGGDYNIEFAFDTIIPADVFSYGYMQSYLESVVLPDTIEEIGNNAFRQCNKLTEINMPSSLTKIGSNAFERCENITSISIPFSCTYIGQNAFMYDSGLTKIELHNTVSTYKVETASAAWFYRGGPGKVIHIPAVIDSAEKAKNVYGACWNFYNDTMELSYVNDLDA